MNIWFPESIYFGGLAYSVVLMTTALLFHHMTRGKTLEMNPVASTVFAITLILISILFASVGISGYYIRLQEMNNDPDLGEQRRRYLYHEIKIWYIYLVLGIMYILIEIFIAYYIIKGTTASLRQHYSR